jgi:hypothetical protein
MIGKTVREYPISIRKDLIQVERRQTKLARYWFRVRVRGCRKLWVAIKPNMEIPEDAGFCESKILRKADGFFAHLTIEKEVIVKRDFHDAIAIDFGIRHVASGANVHDEADVLRQRAEGSPRPLLPSQEGARKEEGSEDHQEDRPYRE